jgi:hypothetical protein
MKPTVSARRNSRSSASSTESAKTSGGECYVVCVRNDGLPASLELRKIYLALASSESREAGMIRVIDESGEDYLYPAGWFIPIDASQELRAALQIAS